MVESLARIHPVRGCLGQGLNPAILITTVLSPSQGEPPTRCLLWVGQWGWGREGGQMEEEPAGCWGQPPSPGG